MKQLEKETLWVIKIGSAMITNSGQGLDLTLIQQICQNVATLKEKGIHIAIVSSGAVATGMQHLNWQKRPTHLPELQAAAAVGQTRLVEAWESSLEKYGLKCAQVLLTHEDALDRKRYLNIRETLNTLLFYNIVPIINENDVVSYDEFCIGDNDTLGALVANLIEADRYIILTDQHGLYNKDPRKFSDAILLHHVKANDPELLKMASPEGGALGKGGMYTKVTAAQKAAKSGTDTYIVYGKEDNALLKIFNHEKVGTRFEADDNTLNAKSRWILNQPHTVGVLVIDDGAEKALLNDKKSLLPIGVISVAGAFLRGDLVTCVNKNGDELGRGICNYNSNEVKLLLKTASKDIINKLGYIITDELIHRNNWVSY